MSEILFAVPLLMLNVVVIMLAMTVKHLSKGICEIEAKLEHYRINLEYIQCCELYNEHRIDELEDILDLNEWSDKVKGE